MNVNTKIKVREDHPSWPGQIGYFQFEGRGPSEGCIVCSEEPLTEMGRHTLFVVRVGDFTVCEDQ